MTSRAPRRGAQEVARTLPAVLLVLALAGCSGDAEPRTAAPPVAASPSPATSPSPAPPPSPAAPEPASPDPAGSKGGVVLGGEDLGVTRLGAPMDEAVRAVSAVLGEPDEDPASAVRCLGATREVRWGELVLAARDGRLAGWSSTSRTLQTPSGVAIGTPLSALEQLYGDTLEQRPADPDSRPAFAVRGVDVLGALSSADEDAVVTALFSRFCSGP